MNASPPALSHVQGRRRPFIHGLILLLVVGSAIYTVLSPGHLFSYSHSGANPAAGLSLPGVAAAVPKGFNPVQTLTSQALTKDTGFSQEVSRLENMAVSHQPGEPISHQPEEPVSRVYAAAVTPEPGATPALLPLQSPVPGMPAESEVAPAGITPATPQPTPPPPPPPMYITYTVQDGDTVDGLAARYGISPQSILWNNLDLKSADLLVPGQYLRVPMSDGIIYDIRLGDTLSDIADRFGVDVQAIVNFSGNNLKSADSIAEHERIFIPNGKMPIPVATPTTVPPPLPPATASPSPARSPSSATGFIWPVNGPISSYFGPSHPLGIDIDQYNSPGAPIHAAASGTVTFAGGDPCCSYGLYVVIDHGNGFETLYAHLDPLAVSQGQSVEQGQVIGYVGLTGHTTGYHLHFEVHLNGQVVNPLDYLP